MKKSILCIAAVLIMSGCQDNTKIPISTESSMPEEIREEGAVQKVSESPPDPNPKASEMSPDSDQQQPSQAISELTPYQVLTKIREIENFTGGTFDGSWDGDTYSFTVPDLSDKDELYVYDTRIFDKANGSIYVHGKDGLEVYYDLLDKTTYPQMNGDHSGIHLNPEQLHSMDLIEQKLYDSPEIFNAQWSPDYQYIAYYSGKEFEGEAYVWKVGEQAPVKILIDKLDRYYFEWSPDSEYLLLDTGTSPFRGGYMYSISRNTVSAYFNYITSVYFSDGSKWIAFSKASEYRAAEKYGFEDDSTFDLMVMDLTDFKIHRILEADDHTDYFPDQWVSDSELIYTKTDYQNDTEVELQIIVDLP